MKENRGYLQEEFRVFYLDGKPEGTVPYHYHEFMKILILLKGQIGYEIEGREYHLQERDVVLVYPGQLHRPLLNQVRQYERIILYISPAFLKGPELQELGEAYGEGEKRHVQVISLEQEEGIGMLQLARHFTDEVVKDGVCGDLLQKVRVVDFLIQLQRYISEENLGKKQPAQGNQVIQQILDYLNTHFTEDLSNEAIAEALHVSKSYMMHLFRQETGYTIKGYITEKRILYAKELQAQNVSLTEACYQSGFNSYTSFYRAMKKKNGDRKGLLDE